MIQQERIKRTYKSIKLPVVFEPEDRGFKECCDPELVLANGDGISYHNDITPAWIKLSSVIDTATFVLKKNGIVTTYTPTVQDFPNEEFAKYIEVEWKDVLASDGIGCYTIEISYSIGGFSATFTFGQYQLKQYTYENAKGTIRLRAVFNKFHEIEGINFKGASVNGTVRCNGFAGNKKTNKEIENDVYSDRVIRSTRKENLNTYDYLTDGLKECLLTKITDLYLLSATDLFLTDHNAFNHTYKINDLPVRLKDPEDIIPTEFSRLSKISAIFIYASRNQRNYLK